MTFSYKFIRIFTSLLLSLHFLLWLPGLSKASPSNSHQLLPWHSFNSPFDAINPISGEREVSGGYSYSGDAIVKQNFVRLTPDRQAKHGAVWYSMSSPLNLDEVSAVMQFRISGQAKLLHGDGLALWIVQQSEYVPGSYYGFTTSFTGIGIILDALDDSSKDNVDMERRIVRVVTNDGSALTAEELNARAVNCAGPRLRHYERRADFSVYNTSRVRVSIRQNHIIVALDSASNNTWVTCVDWGAQNLPPNWLLQSRFGITASTSVVTDNHDIISLQVYDSANAESLTTTDTPAKSEVQPSENILEESNLIEDLQRRIEHQLTDIYDSLKENILELERHERKVETRITAMEQMLNNRITRTLDERLKALESIQYDTLKRQEQDAEERITKLENLLDLQVLNRAQEKLSSVESNVHDKVASTLQERVTALENQVDRRIEQRISRLEAVMSERISSSVADVKGASLRWRLPFAILVTLVFVGLLFLYWRYTVFCKRHSL